MFNVNTDYYQVIFLGVGSTGSLLIVRLPCETRADLVPTDWRGEGEGEREDFLFPLEQERLLPLTVPLAAVGLVSPVSLTAKTILVCLAALPLVAVAGLEAGLVGLLALQRVGAAPWGVSVGIPRCQLCARLEGTAGT